MKILHDLTLFVRTADHGSLSAAARQLDMTPAAASATVKRLEAELGVPLFVRSTRSLRLTTEGEVFWAHARQALQLLTEGREALTAQGMVRGVLQLSLPSDLGRNLVLPWLDEFSAQHPQLELRLDVSDRIADVFRQSVDVALRYGVPQDSSMVALPIVPDNRRVLVAAPAYLQAHVAPTSPAELAQHNCLCFMLGEYVHDRWRFMRDGQELSVSVRGDRLSVDGDVVRRWAVAGKGIAYKSYLDVAHDLHAGRLMRLCSDWATESAPLNLVCPTRRQITTAVQQLRVFLLQEFTKMLALYPHSAFRES